MCLHCEGKVSNCSIKSCGRSWLAHEGTIYSYTKAILGDNCLSSHCCHFVKNIFFEPNSLMHNIFNVSSLGRQSIKLLHQKLWQEMISPRTDYLCIQKVIFGKNCLCSHSCHFDKNLLFWTKLLHAYVQCVYIVKANYQIAPPKSVEGVGRPVYALSYHKHKLYVKSHLELHMGNN